MCYDIRYLTYKQEVYSKRFERKFKNPESAQAKIKFYHALGYDHPDVPVITNYASDYIDFFQWGLIPPWVRDPRKAVTLQNQTLNARGEELSDKASFKGALKSGNRCLILVDGFYEHHHKNSKIFPYYISLKNGEPFALGGLWSHWKSVPGHERNTCTIITTSGNSLLAGIHNNPKLEGPRMPFIVSKNLESSWLKESLPPEEAMEMIKPYESEELDAFPVRRLRGKEAVGNSDLAIKPFNYPELSSSQGTLF